MRLVNARFGTESKFFWNERAATLEAQTIQPIQDHNEMGFSGASGDPSLNDLVTRLSAIAYYRDLFKFVYGDSAITETRIQNALAQFVRSIQSFDSKYDRGRSNVAGDGANFTNFTSDENAGKRLFLDPPNRGGAGCAGCHRPPEFDIAPNSLNNGIIGVFGNAGSQDLTVTRAPTLRDLVNPDGTSNGPFMHDASKASLDAVVEHYDNGITSNTNLDNRLLPGGNPQRLGLTSTEKNQLVLFLKTLTGSDLYTNSKWSDPFL
jgi:cytochrome c peroxidase